MSLTIARVNALPTPVVPNTIYLVPQSATELKIVTVGNTAADIRTSFVKDDVQNLISQAIGALDLSNSAQYAATIAARDALTLTKNSFVLVADATDDVTVKAGAAMYFYNVSDDSWLKIAEYESLDVVIPNQTILEQFSDVGGNLAYKGKLVGTVQAGASEW